MGSYSLKELAEFLGVDFRGDGELSITGLAPLTSAGPSQLSFLAHTRYRQQLKDTAAGAVILQPELVADSPCACLLSDQPYLAFARLSHLFDNAPIRRPGTHPSAEIHPEAKVDPSAAVAALCVIERGAEIGADCRLEPGAVVGENCRIGAGTLLHANVTLYHDVVLGERCIIHSGAVLGGDGFGFAHDGERWVKIRQLGGVRVGDDVEIGASTTVDRGALDHTVIGNNVIIDNQVHIAHNVRIGDHSAIAGCVGISGSTEIGRGCIVAGGVGFVGHIKIADGVHVTGMTMVTKSITEPGSYSSGTAMMESAAWRKAAVRFTQLDDLSRRLAALEKQLQDKS